MSYTYRGGDRPLEGFTIKCGIGRGAFGEVYLAESEGGKYVALKLLTDHSDLELRGIAQCLNLKHPNLIHLYDLRTDQQGRHWLVMEYVIGESLARVLDRHPQGLPPSLAKEWGVSLARAVGYLHDKLVVHRDLKPANIFIEEGQVKVGDFGLCKRMLGSSHRTAHSQGVGTVYYMAPEIDKGHYNKSVDIYACGVILYEMLTGSVPFTGDSPIEILHRHLTDAPELSRIPAAFRPVVEKALEKDPSRRFGSMAEFARALEGVRLDGEAAAVNAPPVKTTVAPPAAKPPVAVALAEPVAPQAGASPLSIVQRDRLSESLGAWAAVPLIAALCTAPWLLVSSAIEWPKMAQVFLLTTALSWAVLLFGRFRRGTEADLWGRRGRMLLVGAAVGLLGYWLDGWEIPSFISDEDKNVPYTEQYLGGTIRASKESLETGLWYVLYFGFVAGAFRWWTITDRQRPERVRLFPVIAMAFWSLVLLVLAPKDATSIGIRIAPLVLSVITIQLAAPWSPPPPPPPRRYRLRYGAH